MARPREFDEHKALEQAMQLFWAKGYESASLQDLLDTMNLSKSSFYQTYGSKHDLFLACIEHYTETWVEFVNSMLNRGPAPKAVANIFKRIVGSAMSQSQRRGCFICNAATEVAQHDPAAAALVEAGLARTEEAYYRTVVRGQKAGEISSDHDPRALARFFVSNNNGLQVMAKANRSRKALNDVIRVVMSTLR